MIYIKPAMAVLSLAACMIVPALCAQERPQQPSYDSAVEDALFQSLNQARQEHGLPALQKDEHLRAAAREHSLRMARKLQLSHQLDGEPALTQRLLGENFRFDRDAENVAFSEAVEDIHPGFMRSPGHRANILSPLYNSAGIGVVRLGSTLWVTQDFAHRLPYLTDEQAENLIADTFGRLAKLPAVKRFSLEQLRRAACAMAKADKLDTSKVLQIKDIRYAVAFTTAAPAELPENVRKLRAEEEVSHFAAGACFAATPQYPAGMFWVLMAFY